jgi:hypothetical protein
MKRDRPKVPTAVHGPLKITYHPNEKANMIADCLENYFISHDLCDENESSARTCRHQTLGKNNTLWHTEISKDIEIEKDL